MEKVLDILFGFLPHRAVLLVGIGTSFIIIVAHFGIKKVQKWIELPYMKQENRKARARMVQQVKNEKQTES